MSALNVCPPTLSITLLVGLSVAQPLTYLSFPPRPKLHGTCVLVPLFLPRGQGDGFFLEEADSSTSKSKNKRKKNKAKKKSKGAGTTDDDAEGAAAAAAAATAAAAEMAGEEGDVSRRRRLGGT